MIEGYVKSCVKKPTGKAWWLTLTNDKKYTSYVALENVRPGDKVVFEGMEQSFENEKGELIKFWKVMDNQGETSLRVQQPNALDSQPGTNNASGDPFDDFDKFAEHFNADIVDAQPKTPTPTIHSNEVVQFYIALLDFHKSWAGDFSAKSLEQAAWKLAHERARELAKG